MTRMAVALGQAVAIIVAASESAASLTLRVPADYITIQAGLDAAAAGDTVLVAPGTYTDYEVRLFDGFERTACAFLVDGVVLRSEGGAAFTTIDLQGVISPQANVIYGRFLDSGETRVEGFTITGTPLGRSGARLYQSEKVTFSSCVFVDLDGGQTTAGGLLASEADTDVIDCEFINCRASTAGGIFQNHARLFVANCTFVGCWRGIFVGGATNDPPGELIVEDSRFIRNQVDDVSGGAISASQYRNGVTIRRCYFEECEAEFGGGAISMGGDVPQVIEDSVFWMSRTTEPGSGGAAFVVGSAAVVRGNTFVASSGGFPQSSAAAWFQGGVSEFKNNIIVGSRNGVGIRAESGATIVGGCNVFWDNPDGEAIGYELDPTDRIVAPEFCNPDSGDFTVTTTSPCLPENSMGCGQVGALGEGCLVISVHSESWGSIKGKFREREGE